MTVANRFYKRLPHHPAASLSVQRRTAINGGQASGQEGTAGARHLLQLRIREADLLVLVPVDPEAVATIIDGVELQERDTGRRAVVRERVQEAVHHRRALGHAPGARAAVELRVQVVHVLFGHEQGPQPVPIVKRGGRDVRPLGLEHREQIGQHGAPAADRGHGRSVAVPPVVADAGHRGAGGVQERGPVRQRQRGVHGPGAVGVSPEAAEAAQGRQRGEPAMQHVHLQPVQPEDDDVLDRHRRPSAGDQRARHGQQQQQQQQQRRRWPQGAGTLPETSPVGGHS